MIFLKDLKELFSILPHMSRDLVDISELTSVGLQTIRDSRNKELNFSLRTDLSSRLDASFVVEVERIPQVDSPLSRSNSERVLRLYFEQLSWDGRPVHFDLRRKNFSERSDDRLGWLPSKLHYTFSKEFLDGLKQLYQGFYFENREQFFRGLYQTKILSRDDAKNLQEEAFELFQNYFGAARSAPMRFDLRQFTSGFTTIFSFFLKNKKKLSIDFAYLGIYLSSLYVHLDKSPYELNVKEAFLNSRLSAL